MKIYQNLNEIPSIERGTMTIGTFDGFHLGHRKIISRLKEHQEKNGGDTFVITFANHPFEILFPEKVPEKVGTLDFKVNLLRESGIDHLILIEFTKAFADMTHDDFFNIISSRFQYLQMVLGTNFRFGKGNIGDVHYIKSLESKDHFRLELIPDILLDGVKVSSSLIRRLIHEGQFEFVSQMLSRDYYIEGNVMKGDQIGRDIGFPTVNLENKSQVWAKEGVYKTETEVNGERCPGMTFVGIKSVNSSVKKKMIETHIFDFNGDLYGTKIKVFFQKRIRNEMKFQSLNELKDQLVKDKEKVLSID